MKRLLCIVLLWAILPFQNGYGYDDQTARETLRGISATTISVTYWGRTESEPPGLSIDQVKNNVELRLREAGIRVVDPKEAVRLKHVSAELLVLINCMDYQSIYPCYIETQLVQAVHVEKNDQFTVAPTWSVKRFALLGADRIRAIHDYTKDMVDQFLNAYLAMNPR
ncbi:MAG: hypothetical protein HOP35_09640 [Nitrospira sp.]|nr:hypothetical protein [Nitrospira sp.]